MAKNKKRRSKKTPNLPLDVLEQARQQLDEMAEEEDDLDEDFAEEDGAEETASGVETGLSGAERAARRKERRERRKKEGASEGYEYSRRKKKSDDMHNTEIEEKLMHPTKFVSEAELREEYKHVIADLRSMGLLAAALFVFLVVVAQAL